MEGGEFRAMSRLLFGRLGGRLEDYWRSGVPNKALPATTRQGEVDREIERGGERGEEENVELTWITLLRSEGTLPSAPGLVTVMTQTESAL